MASSALSLITPPLLCSSKMGMHSPSQSLLVKPMMMRSGKLGWWKGRKMKVSCMAASVPADDRVPEMGKRQLMILLLTWLSHMHLSLSQLGNLSSLDPYVRRCWWWYCRKDGLGHEIIAEVWLKNHGPGDRSLAQGLKGDPTYLVVENDRTLATYGINAVCTHLGCVVPWNAAENKFICPRHGSQYNNEGRVVRGPAPLFLALAHADIDDGKVVFVPWAETDFRTGEEPWWA